MKRQIAIWATVGALVVVAWRIYLSATFSNPLATGGIAQALIYLTCPIAIAGRYPLGFYFVLAVNAATYALAGLVVENTRRFYRLHSHPIGSII